MYVAPSSFQFGATPIMRYGISINLRNAAETLLAPYAHILRLVIYCWSSK